jgi:hypothetical protein
MPTRTLLLLLLLTGSKLFAQTTEKFSPALMQTKAGAKMVYTSDSHSITFDFIFKKVEPTGKENFINVDNKPLQFILIPNSALSTTDTTLKRQKAELLGYATYETDYIKNDLKLNIANITQKWITINGKLFLFWTYDMPPDTPGLPSDSKSVLQQLHLSTLCFAHVLNLNIPVSQGETADANSTMLLSVAKTLQLNDFKIDLAQLYKKLQAEMGQ